MDDNEKKRNIDRICAIIFKEAKDEGAQFITQAWVAKQLGRNETFVQDNWKKDPYNCGMDKRLIGKADALNEHEK